MQNLHQRRRREIKRSERESAQNSTLQKHKKKSKQKFEMKHPFPFCTPWHPLMQLTDLMAEDFFLIIFLKFQRSLQISKRLWYWNTLSYFVYIAFLELHLFVKLSNINKLITKEFNASKIFKKIRFGRQMISHYSKTLKRIF